MATNQSQPTKNQSNQSIKLNGLNGINGLNRINAANQKAEKMPLSQYTILNDVYPIGDTEIWYCKEFDGELDKDFMFYGFSKDLILPKSHTDLEKTHVMLGRIRETNLERIFCMMQGEEWSRHGEARTLINGLNLCHTSMSVGDIIVISDKSESEAKQGYICGKCGFDRLF